MAHGPVLVRIPQRPPRQWLGAKLGPLRLTRLLLLLVGIGGLSFYGYTLADQYLYQSFQNWAFDQQIAGRPHVSFFDFVREKTALAKIMPAPADPEVAPVKAPARPVRPATGALLGRVVIPRLNLSAMVREGVDSVTLSRAVGHVPSTALPGQNGNFAIAAHRDTLFRALKDIQQGDTVYMQTAAAAYEYEVFHTRIVKPSEVSVLRADGGLPPQYLTVANRPAPLLTMITCYPFYYVGSAPERFIVQARLVGPSNSPAAARPFVKQASLRRTAPASITPRRLSSGSANGRKPLAWHRFVSSR